MKFLKKFFTKKKILWTSVILLLVLIISSPFFFLHLSKNEKVLKTNKSTCIEGIFFLPNTYSINANFKYDEKGFSNIFSNKLCFEPTELLPEEESFDVKISVLGDYGIKLFEKTFNFSTNSYPKIEDFSPKEEYAVNEKVSFTLDQEDELFNYYLSIEESEIQCEKEGVNISCNLEELDLKQGSEYELKTFSKFSDQKIKDFDVFKIKTPGPVTVQSSNIVDEAVLNKEISDIDISFNKEVDSVMEIILEKSNGENIEFEYSVEGKELGINTKEKIEFGNICKLIVRNVQGTDGSFLEGDYVLNFSVVKYIPQNWWNYPDDITLTPKSGNDLLVVVSKKYKLPDSYAPSDLVRIDTQGIRSSGQMYLRSIVVNDLKKLMQDAQSAGVTLSIKSAYRSYATQISTYQYWVSYNGGNVNYADQVSARPGHSEHQLGTTVDFGTNEGVAFNNSRAAKWLQDNAWKYGFVLSYPNGSHTVTGFTYEGWHYRYIGIDNARKQTESGLIPLLWLQKQ